MSGLLSRFSNQGSPAKIKLVIVGASAEKIENAMQQLRSLNPEHVSPTALMRQEISRHTQLGQKAEAAQKRGQPLAQETTLALMRRWFMTRKPDAGYALTGFPATLLQAKVFDEWLEARDETLDAVIDATSPGNAEPQLGHVLNHYRAHGHLILTDETATAARAN